MSRVARQGQTDEPESYFSYAVFPWLVIGYFWFHTTTPYRSNILGFLEDIRFERILLACMLLVCITTNRFKSIASPITFLYLALFAWMFVAYLFSDYSYSSGASWWLTEYWKVVFAFLLIASGIRDQKEACFILLGYAGVIAFYQVHTWYDFLNGGSYVYQQGVKRMIGVWSGGGLGSANSFASMALTGIALGYFAMVTGWRRWVQLCGLGTMVVSVASIAFSGTRGGLISAGALLGIILTLRVGLIRAAVLAIVGAAGLWTVLPAELKDRYLSITFDGSEKGMSQAEEIAAESAEGRLEGVVDGFRMANESPIVGQGPGVSALARLKFRRMEQPLQLHNQIAQAVGELGYIGLLLWLALLFASMAVAWKIFKDPTQVARTRYATQCAAYVVLALILYGAVSHNVYQYKWIFFWAVLVALQRGVLTDASKNNSKPRAGSSRQRGVHSRRPATAPRWSTPRVAVRA